MCSAIWSVVSEVPFSAGAFIAGFPSPFAPWHPAHFDLYIIHAKFARYLRLSCFDPAGFASRCKYGFAQHNQHASGAAVGFLHSGDHAARRDRVLSVQPDSQLECGCTVLSRESTRESSHWDDHEYESKCECHLRVRRGVAGAHQVLQLFGPRRI